MAYPTTAELKAYLGAATATDDTLIAAFGTAAQGYIEGRAGADRRFAVTADTTRYFDAERDVSRDHRTLRLDEDLCAITSITNGDGTAVTAAMYVTEPRNQTPYRALTMKVTTSASIWLWQTSPENAITIVGKWGYSTTPPEDIKDAYKGLVAYLYRRRSNSGGDLDRAVAADGILLMPGQVPKYIQSVLTAYRRRALT